VSGLPFGVSACCVFGSSGFDGVLLGVSALFSSGFVGVLLGVSTLGVSTLGVSTLGVSTFSPCFGKTGDFGAWFSCFLLGPLGDGVPLFSSVLAEGF